MSNSSQRLLNKSRCARIAPNTAPANSRDQPYLQEEGVEKLKHSHSSLQGGLHTIRTENVSHNVRCTRGRRQRKDNK
jgi:hypothetical protein